MTVIKGFWVCGGNFRTLLLVNWYQRVLRGSTSTLEETYRTIVQWQISADLIDNVQTPHPSSSRLRNWPKCFLKVRPKGISTKKQSFSTSSQNHHIMALKNGKYFLFAFDLGNRPIGAQPIPEHLNQQVIVQYRGTQAHKVSNDILMFPNAYWYSVIRTVVPRTYKRLEIYNRICSPRTSEGCGWRCTSGRVTWSPFHMGYPNFKLCTTCSWTVIFLSSWPYRLSYVIFWRYYVEHLSIIMLFLISHRVR